MSFSKSKRFPYSKSKCENLLSPNESRIVKNIMEKSKNPKHSLESLENICDSGNMIRGIRRKENNDLINKKINLQDKTVKNHPLNQFLITSDADPNKKRNPIKKITNGLKRTILNNVYPKNEYNVKKEEEKQLKRFDPNSTFTYERFAIDLNKSNPDDENIDEVILFTNTKIKTLLRESVMKIKENSNRRFKCFLAEIIAYSVFTLEEVQNQCEIIIDDMNCKVKDALKKNEANYTEKKYKELLKNANKKISQQEMLIQALKTEIDAIELTNSMEKILKQQKKI